MTGERDTGSLQPFSAGWRQNQLLLQTLQGEYLYPCFGDEKTVTQRIFNVLSKNKARKG